MLATLPLPDRIISAVDLRRALRQDPEEPVALDASALDRVLRHDAARGLLEVQAGTTWRSLTAALDRSRPGLSGIASCATLPGTVGESIAANTPGPDGMPLVAHVETLTLATADGELRRASRFENAKLFRLAVGGQGAVGVFYSATLRLDSLEQSLAQTVPSEHLGQGRAPGSNPACRVCLLLPPHELDGFLADARSQLSERRAPLLGVTVRRTRAERESFLRWAVREYAWVAIEFDAGTTLGNGVRTEELRRWLLGAALARGGAFPAAECAGASREQAEACFPMLAEFLAQARRYDPAGRLQNRWLRRCRALLQREACDVRWSI